MTPLLIAMLVAGGGALAMMTDVFGSDDDTDATEEEQETPPDEPEQEPEPDLGASVVELEDGRIEVELGEDETGHLYAFLNTDESDSTGTGSVSTTDLTLLLVPEPIEIPEGQLLFADPPEETVDGRPFVVDEDMGFTRANLVDYFGATELGHWDLGRESDSAAPYYDRGEAINFFSNRIDLQFVSDAPITAIEAYGGPDGFEYDRFREIDNLDIIQKSAAVQGTDADETFGDDGIGYVNARGGDDMIDVVDTHIDAGDGNDTIIATNNADVAYGGLVDAGAGDDLLILEGHARTTAWGGDGNDTIIATDGFMELHGDQGDDTFIVLDNSFVLTDEGNDTVMIWDQDLGQTEVEEPLRLAALGVGSGETEFVILTRNGEEPVSMVQEGRLFTLTYANGSVGTISATIDPDSVTFRDVDEVLAEYPVDTPPAPVVS